MIMVTSVLIKIEVIAEAKEEKVPNNSECECPVFTFAKILVILGG